MNWSPRAGVAIGVLPEGRGDPPRRLREVRAAHAAQRRGVSVVRTADGLAVRRRRRGCSARRSTFANVIDADLQHARSERRQRRVEPALRPARCCSSWHSCGVAARTSTSSTPEPAAGAAALSSSGHVALPGTGGDDALSGRRAAGPDGLVRLGRGTADLNNYDQFFGNFRNPIVRANENSLIPTDVPHRLLVRGTIGLPGKWDFAPVLELRSGFPWSAVNEFQDFVGPRNRAGRLPAVRTLDFTLSRPWQFRKYRFRAGLKMYNVFGASASATCRTTSPRPTTARSTTRSSARSVRVRVGPLNQVRAGALITFGHGSRVGSYSRWRRCTGARCEPADAQQPRRHQRERRAEQAQQHAHAGSARSWPGGKQRVEKNSPTLKPIAT